MDYSKWLTKKIATQSLLVDPDNPRIPPSATPRDQRDLIGDLVLHENVYELAKNIALNGYFPNEAPIGVYENRSYVIVEGNRRVAACKLLLDPTLAPTDEMKRFKSLREQGEISGLKRLSIIVAPSRSAAAPIIVSRHTDVQIEQWQPLMKAHYYASQLSGGATIDDLAHRLHLSSAEIKRHHSHPIAAKRMA